jgi:AcrR family transcriptional regulator
VSTKDKIITTALELFLRDGYERTSLNRIADRVGITKPAIYHHFASKDELVHEVLSFFFGGMREWSVGRFAGCGSLKELLRALLESMGSYREVTTDLLGKGGGGSPYGFLGLLLTASERDPGIRRRIEQTMMRSRKAVEDELLKAQQRGEIRGDIDCEEYALQIHALIEGTTLISCLDKTVDIETAGTRMFENVWKMLQG